MTEMTHAPESGAAMPPTEGRDALRERLCARMDRIVGQGLSATTVDTLLAEIERAGCRIVPADQLQRLRGAAFYWYSWHHEFGSPHETALTLAGLEPGDLDLETDQ